MISSEDQMALKMIRLGYAVDDPTDRERCLNFRVGFDSADSAMEACRIIDSYNNFSGTQVADAIRKVAALSGTWSTFYVGREGSPVVYIRCFGEKINQVAAILNEAGPDECEADNGYVRAWWD